MPIPGSFFLFSFLLCNHAFIVFRYKKPHAELAIERTKPINQKQPHRKVTAPIKVYYHKGSPSDVP